MPATPLSASLLLASSHLHFILLLFPLQVLAWLHLFDVHTQVPAADKSRCLRTFSPYERDCFALQVRGWLYNSPCGTASGCHHHLQMHLLGTQCSFKRLKCFYVMCCCSFKMSKALAFAILLVGLALSSTGEPVSHLHFCLRKGIPGLSS